MMGSMRPLSIAEETGCGLVGEISLRKKNAAINLGAIFFAGFSGIPDVRHCGRDHDGPVPGQRRGRLGQRQEIRRGVDDGDELACAPRSTLERARR